MTAQLREMTLEALERLGGVDYLEWLGKNEPAVFGSLLRRCMPQAIEATVSDRKMIKIVDFSGKGKSAHPDESENPS